jgi:hypothetical protein
LKAKIQKVFLGVFLALVISLVGSRAAFAQTETASVEVFRIFGTWVGIKIIFPNDISGNFAGVLNGKHFDCATIPSNTLYCMGPFAQWSDEGTLFIYDNVSDEIVLKKVINPPLGSQGEEVTPPAEVTPPPPTDDTNDVILLT